MFNLVTYTSKNAQMRALAHIVADELQTAVEEKGSARLVVPGGSTPVPFFEALSQIDLPWQNITVLLTDERFVPDSSERSNTRLVRHRLLQNRAAVAAFLPFWQEGFTPEALAKELAADIAAFTPFDVCILGMGADMHTASLFPAMEGIQLALEDPNDSKILAVRPESQAEVRLSLTAPMLRNAHHLHLLITGADKLVALHQANATEDATLAPIQALLTGEHTVQIHYAS